MEDEVERGVAHIVEHLAFNATEARVHPSVPAGPGHRQGPACAFRTAQGNQCQWMWATCSRCPVCWGIEQYHVKRCA